MTQEEFDIHEPYRCYVYMMLMFDCHGCRRLFGTSQPYEENSDWQWFHDAADQAWRAGWYVAPHLPDDSSPLFCLCPACAARKNLSPPAARH